VQPLRFIVSCSLRDEMLLHDNDSCIAESQQQIHVCSVHAVHGDADTPVLRAGLCELQPVRQHLGCDGASGLMATVGVGAVAYALGVHGTRCMTASVAMISVGLCGFAAVQNNALASALPITKGLSCFWGPW